MSRPLLKAEMSLLPLIALSVLCDSACIASGGKNKDVGMCELLKKGSMML